ncbi:MAG: PrsW family intramembrane metalloprotease, partial [Spirochaetales bacterium]|nr:PrsW family intramembrane metalloprotease [Spirochaetales bacterium]
MIQLLLILIINTLVLIAWGKYLHHLDAFTVDKKNEHRLFWFIVTGSILNTILVSMMYPLWENILFSLTGLGFGINPFITHFLIVGPVEEFTKFLVFIFLTGIFQSIKEPRDGILQAVSIALGFALMENFLYALDYGIGVLLMRSILSIIGHSTYAAIWGFAWSSTVYTTDKDSKSPDR